jgi:hypothetical protein
MTNTSTTIMTLAEFERLLDVYGGDRAHWTIEARAAAAQLVARDTRAQRLLAEAEALDRVLDRAPVPSLVTEAALADRIVAAAQRSPRIVSIKGGEEATSGAPADSERQASRPAPADPYSRAFRTDLRKAAMLAASLVIGIYIGLSNLPQQIVPALTGDAAGDPYNLALTDPFDEDVL